jgi:hypothetical protein
MIHHLVAGLKDAADGTGQGEDSAGYMVRASNFKSISMDR